MRTYGRPTVYAARALVALAFLALLGAWTTQLTGGTLLGMTPAAFLQRCERARVARHRAVR